MYRKQLLVVEYLSLLSHKGNEINVTVMPSIQCSGIVLLALGLLGELFPTL